MDAISGTIAIVQGLVGTCKAIDIVVTAVTDAQETLQRWNVMSAIIRQTSQQLEAALQDRKATRRTENPPEETYYGAISAHLDQFHRDLQKLEANISKANNASPYEGSSSKASLRSRLKLAFTMDWKETDQLFKWMDRHVTLLQINADLVRGVNNNSMTDIQRVLGTGHASRKPVPRLEPLHKPELELPDWLLPAESFAKHIALRDFDPSDSGILTPNETDWDLVQDTPDTININTVSLLEREYRLNATMQQVDHLDASNIPVISANVQLEVIRLSNEVSEAKGVTLTFQERFRHQERYVNLLLKSTETHDVYGVRAQEYLRGHIIPNVNREDTSLERVWLSVGKMYYALKAWRPATEWLRLALLHGFVRHGREVHRSEIEEISKLICQIYEKEGHPENAIALRKILTDRLGYDPTKIPDDLEKAVEWCRLKKFVVWMEGDQLVFKDRLNLKGNSALHEAAQDIAIDAKMLPKLMKDDLLAVKNASGDTALLLAVDKDNVVAISSLLNIPALLHIRDREGRTPLHRCHDHKTLRLLLDALEGSRRRSSLTHVDPNSHDASSLIDIDTQDACGRTALFMACDQGNWRVAKMLLDAGADVNISDKTGACPLLACSASLNISSAKRDEMILRLRDKGAEPGQKDKYGNTARTKLVRLYQSSKRVDRLLSIDPGAELDRLEKSKAERRGSGATASTARSTISLGTRFSWERRTSSSSG
ncbi:e3 ubiquitin ligase HACE1 [Fusarium phyllophilum]|uniref:E3 ubiquitin ligase HACE1 n=1 Tax=Fusarium phyllophilum TaxID=47803 RepID=A0A8H5IIS2_9HYPO|nr:e3 ubiquitin ligase HACE1 [Fusarium phyllophilum]